MTLGETLLQKLDRWRPGGRETLTAAADGWTAVVTADCADQVGCRLWEVALRPAQPLPAADPKARALAVAGRVTGLLEPLALVEADADRRTAQLRSAAPAVRGDDRLYYELLLEGNGAAMLRRHQTTRQAPRREQTAFTLTHDALAKLVDDLTAC